MFCTSGRAGVQECSGGWETGARRNKQASRDHCGSGISSSAFAYDVCVTAAVKPR